MRIGPKMQNVVIARTNHCRAVYTTCVHIRIQGPES